MIIDHNLIRIDIYIPTYKEKCAKETMQTQLVGANRYLKASNAGSGMVCLTTPKGEIFFIHISALEKIQKAF